MSECGTCGRRWVEPRLLPCLHTLCTPCLHTRATQITPPTTITSTTTAASRNDQTTPTPGSRCGSRLSQEHEVIAASSTPTATPNPSLAHEADSGENSMPLCNGNITTTNNNERLPTTTTSPTFPDTYGTSSKIVAKHVMYCSYEVNEKCGNTWETYHDYLFPIT